MLAIRLKQYRVILRIRKLKKKAMRLHRKYNDQFYVVKLDGRVTVIGKKLLKRLRAKRSVPLNFTATELKQISLFHTPKRYDKKRAQRAVRKVQTAKPGD